MPTNLTVSVGQYSDKGCKDINQDFHGALLPAEPFLSSKGIAVAMADGISSSNVSQDASQTAVTGFLADYMSTSEAWSVKSSMLCVLTAINGWLYAQSQKAQSRFEPDKGYVCTFSALVVKSRTAHLMHCGDTRIYRIQSNSLEQLTVDHRQWVSAEKSYLGRALGIGQTLDADYRTVTVEQGDIFVLATDGVYEYLSASAIVETIAANAHDLDLAAKTIIDAAYQQGSLDNLTIQIVRIDSLPEHDVNEIAQQIIELPPAPLLESRMHFDGYTIIRELHASHRSHVYLAVDQDTGREVVIKTPSIDLKNDQAYLERFLLEDWIAKRINNVHVLKPVAQTRKRHYLYLVTEYIQGQTLQQWMIDHPKPALETVRMIIEQIAKGLRAFHRLEMLHQDLRPENIMIDQNNTVKIIDFGSTSVPGIREMHEMTPQQHILGTAQYTAPEYFLSETPKPNADLFSLGVITYRLLTGGFPYGAKIARTTSRVAQENLIYHSAREESRALPVWVDDAIKKALHPNPLKRYAELSEFIFDMRHPNKAFLNKTRAPLLERNPVLFWKMVALILAAINLWLLTYY